MIYVVIFGYCAGDVIGSRTRLKIWGSKDRVGSSPTPRTKIFRIIHGFAKIYYRNLSLYYLWS